MLTKSTALDWSVIKYHLSAHMGGSGTFQQFQQMKCANISIKTLQIVILVLVNGQKGKERQAEDKRATC